LKYWNEKLQVGLKDWRTAYLLEKEPVLLTPEVYKGNLVYRAGEAFAGTATKKSNRVLLKKDKSLLSICLFNG
jgi:hypothetical protein